MEKQNIMKIVSVGLAMFSMFFGSGNTVFPVLIGTIAGSNSLWALGGLLITAVLIPFAGLLIMFLFKGDYFLFFKRLGNIPSWLIISTIFALIGPFAVIPRCIVISFSSIETFLPGKVFLPTFSCLSGLIIYLCTRKKSKIVQLLGNVLTPILLISLFIVVLKGFFNSSSNMSEDTSKAAAFFLGIREGYNTMDLLGAFMFSGVVLNSIRWQTSPQTQNNYEIFSICLKASFVGMGLLSLVYVSMCLVASRFSTFLTGVPAQKMLSTMALHILGEGPGIIVAIAISLACLTTAVSLALVFSEFLQKKISQNKLSYKTSLLITTIISSSFAMIDFSGIQSFVVPILQVLLPALIVLTICNALYKIWGFRWVKTPFYLSLVLSFLFYYVF